MKEILACVLGLATLGLTIPSEYEDDLIFRRAIDGQCKAAEGTGSCQNTANCPGMSYPTGLCPKDPKDVQVWPCHRTRFYRISADFPKQCCVKITCSVPSAGSGCCRSVKNNGCSGGTFHAGFCPGNTDIKCCVKSTPKSPAPPPPPPSSPCTVAAYNKLMFSDSISTFMAAKKAEKPTCFNWNDDGCSCSPDDLGEHDFLDACKRHDFGYRNAKNMGRFDATLKERIDNNFKDDLYDVCNEFSGWQSYKGV